MHQRQSRLLYFNYNINITSLRIFSSSYGTENTKFGNSKLLSKGNLKLFQFFDAIL